ncbi:MAG: hypothetical protein IJX49_06440 [Clostridia bacterium]|nr:hypothetical protein [Clostridia bacterium]
MGAKGVNGTFVFSDTQTKSYEGFCVEGFLDEHSFRRAVVSVITSVRQHYKGVIDEVYVGVPSAFVQVVTKGHTILFPNKRKITAQDVDALYESGLNDLMVNGYCIRRSAMYLSLGDNRKYFSADELYGVSTDLLKGALCYYFVSASFFELVNSLLEDLSFTSIKFVPSSLAQSVYLIPHEKREGYAFLLDIGFLTTTISVVYGNGIVHEETFNCGVGTILVALMEGLNVDYPVAEDILASANISGGSVPKGMLWYNDVTNDQILVEEINDIIKCSLDVLCENVESFFARRYRDKASTILMVNPISITGEGITCIKGGAEHVAKRLNRLTEIVAPDLPYYDKPSFSSRIGLLNDATSEQPKKRGWLHRIFNGFGGKKK